MMMENKKGYRQHMEEERKSKLVAGLLGIFLGSFGVHNFYLGYKERAILQVSLTGGGILLAGILMGLSAPLMFVFGLGIITMLFGIIMIMAVLGIRIWTLVEGIMIIAGGIKVDGNGIPLKE